MITQTTFTFVLHGMENYGGFEELYQFFGSEMFFGLLV